MILGPNGLGGKIYAVRKTVRVIEKTRIGQPMLGWVNLWGRNNGQTQHKNIG